MNKLLIIDDSLRDSEKYKRILEEETFEIKIQNSAQEAFSFIDDNKFPEFSAIIILWEITGPPFGFELIKKCSRVLSGIPVVMITGMLDAHIASRAHTLGVDDILEKPIDSIRLRNCIKRLVSTKDPLLPLVGKIREKLLGNSSSFLKALSQVAKVIPHRDSRVLLIGSSGTGKELLARAIHYLGPNSNYPWVPVNTGAIANNLVESALFGHEKGAFTGAADQHIGYLEEVRDGTLFLDEIGDLPFALQVKLLRVIQEKEFRRLNGTKDIPFNARLVCATHKNLSREASEGIFRLDLFHRIAEIVIYLPPLQKRKEDINLLLYHFLNKYRQNREVRFSREALTILNSYSFPGNIRELANIVRSSLVTCDGAVILPTHLPLEKMRSFAKSTSDFEDFSEIEWSDSLLNLGYKDALEKVTKAFDKKYLPRKIEQSKYNITKASSSAGLDPKTFRKKWEKSGLGALKASQEKING